MSPSTEETRRDSGAGAIIYSFLWGALVGGAITLLLAPARGAETRARIEAGTRESRQRARKAVERGRTAVDRTRTHLKDQAAHASRVMTEAGQAVTEIRERGEHALGTIKREAAEAVADAKAAYREVRSEFEDDRDEPS